MPKWSGEGELIPGSRCPKCSAPMEYNGNYWCSDPACTWTLREGGPKAEDEAAKIAYVLLMKQRGQEPSAQALEDW